MNDTNMKWNDNPVLREYFLTFNQGFQNLTVPYRNADSVDIDVINKKITALQEI